MDPAPSPPPDTLLAIMDGTRKVIAQGGPHKFRMSAVASVAGISRPTLYKYFPSKEVLLERLTIYEKERFDRRLREVVSAQRTPARRLDAALRCLVTYLDGLMGPDPMGVDLAFAVGSLQRSIGPQSRAFARILGDALDEIPAVRDGRLSRIRVSEFCLRVAYSHYLIPHPQPERLLTDLRHFAGFSLRSSS